MTKITKESFKYDNTVTIAQVPPEQISFYEDQMKSGKRLSEIKDLECQQFKNLVMKYWRDLYCVTLWDQAAKVIITDDTSSPDEEDEAPTTGILYTADSTFEIGRVAENPYYISYTLLGKDGSGNALPQTWGSLHWLTSGDVQINRVISPVTVISGYAVFVELEAKFV
jgi:hypothetical protein